MSDELLEITEEFFKKLLSSRLSAFSVMFIVMLVRLLGKLLQMQILDGSEYQETYTQKTEKNVITPGSRGNIYDRNGNRLVCSEPTYPVTTQDLGDYSRPSSRDQMLYRLVRVPDRRDETVEGKFEIALDQSGGMFFTSSFDSTGTRFFLDFYGLSSTASLSDPEDKYPANITARETFEHKKVDYELDKTEGEKGNPLIIPDSIALGMINVIYTMKLTEYQKYETTTAVTNISNETIVEINENAADLEGVAVEQSYACKYEDSVYFVPIIGCTGEVQGDQLSALNEQWHQLDEVAGLPKDAPDKYDLNGIMDHIEIGKSMKPESQGEKGYSKMYVDNTGRSREIIEKTDVEAGDDVYLTVDRDLQIAVYKLTEQQLAGIISYYFQYDDLGPDKTYNLSKISIPVKDAYYQLINNNVLFPMDMSQRGVSDIEKQIYNKYEASRDQILGAIRNELFSSYTLAINDPPEDIATYMNYIYTHLSDGSVGTMQKDKIDQPSLEYQARRDGTISLRGYIYSKIVRSWVDTTRLDVTSKYSNAGDIFIQLVDHTVESLRSDNKFTKRMSRYLTNDEVITDCESCLALYAQGVLVCDAQAITALQMGDSTCTYQLIKEKISNLELMPVQLTPDPCMAGVAVMDVKTDEARVLVTYPGHDNNLMSDSMDTAYFSQLQGDIPGSLYNNATQAQKAPGPVSKPITAVTALEKGVIELQDTIEYTGIYNQTSKPIKRWTWPGYRSSESIGGDIQSSCNYLFAELAHRLCMKPDGTYSPDQGLATLRKYAALFGLDHTSGVEISENEPQISSEGPECSTMGQGTHSYTNIQFSRCVVVLANRGNMFELSLLDKLTDSNGNLIKDYIPTINSHVDAANSTWDAIRTGIHWVITDSSVKSVFSDPPMEVAGKAGMTQKSKSRFNHAFFVSFVLYNHLGIAMTVNIPYGYAGTNAATLGRKMYEYHYKYTTLEQIEGPGTLGASSINTGD